MTEHSWPQKATLTEYNLNKVIFYVGFPVQSFDIKLIVCVTHGNHVDQEYFN